MLVQIREVATRHPRVLRYTKKAVKRIVPLSLAIYFIPKVLAFYLCCGLLDVLRNQRRTVSTLDRYFAGNGIITWLLSPFNLLMDVLAFPFRNKGVYKLSDLPKAHQEEIQSVIDAAHKRDVVGELEKKLSGQKRGMFFFKWYGRNMPASIDVPEFHRHYNYIRTVGVSVFNKKQSTGKHFGPLRMTLRVLYNINTIEDKNVYIKVGGKTHRWCENKLFIFDDTLQHQSCNESDGVRYCLFVDILRPSLFSGLSSGMLSCVRLAVSRFHAVFYHHWTFIR